MRKTRAALLFMMPTFIFGSVRPYGSEDLRWLAQHAQVIVSIVPTSVALHPPAANGCATVEFQVAESLRPKTLSGTSIHASDPTGIVLGLCANGSCSALAGAVIYISTETTRRCPGLPTVIGITPSQGDDMAVVDFVNRFLAADDKLAWTLQERIARPKDELVARTAVSVAMEEQATDSRAQSLLRSVVLSDDIDVSIRANALKVLGTTDSPVRNDVIQDLRQTNAPASLKRDSLDFLDQSEAAHQILIHLASDTDVAGTATRLLNERFSSSTPDHLLKATLPVADPAATALDATRSLLQSTLQQNEKKKSIEVMLNRIPDRDRLKVLDDARVFAKRQDDRLMLDKMVKEANK